MAFAFGDRGDAVQEEAWEECCGAYALIGGVNCGGWHHFEQTTLVILRLGQLHDDG